MPVRRAVHELQREREAAGRLAAAGVVRARREPALAFFAGIWTSWTSVRKLKEGEVTADLFAFLTTEPNKEVRAIHPNAMPVILRTPEEIDQWLTAPTAEALTLQRPLPDGALRIVARGAKKDEGGLAA
jgi:putative SOS response-associated peptidase YedK